LGGLGRTPATNVVTRPRATTYVPAGVYLDETFVGV
jgi:hypothetical protein